MNSASVCSPQAIGYAIRVDLSALLSLGPPAVRLQHLPLVLLPPCLALQQAAQDVVPEPQLQGVQEGHTAAAQPQTQPGQASKDPILKSLYMIISYQVSMTIMISIDVYLMSYVL